MQVTKNTFLQFIEFTGVTNWSVQYLKGTAFSYNKDFELVPIKDFLTRNKTGIDIQDGVEYKRVTIKLNNGGVFLRDTERGENIGTKKQFIVEGGEFIMSKIDARNGAFGIVPNELKGAIITNDFPSFYVDNNLIKTEFLILLLGTKEFLDFAQQGSSGTTGRQRVDMNIFLQTKIPLPSVEIQNKIVDAYKRNITEAEQAETQSQELEKEIESYLMEELGIEIKVMEKKEGLNFCNFFEIESWGVAKILFSRGNIESLKYDIVKIGEDFELIRGVTYSKTSEVSSSGYKVLRANNIDLGGNLNLKDIKCISKQSECFSDIKKLKKNDIFVCLASGSKDHVGKVTYINENTDFYFGGFMGSIRVKTGRISPQFLFVVINSKLFNKYLSDRIFGANINNLNSELLYSFSYPLPPLDIQEKIVAHIGELKDKVRTLKEKAEDLRELAKREFEEKIFS